MAERMTSARLAGVYGQPGTTGYAAYGRVEPKDMIEQFRAYARHQLAEAQAVLGATDEDFIVETYKGVHVERDRKRLWPVEPDGSAS